MSLRRFRMAGLCDCVLILKCTTRHWSSWKKFKKIIQIGWKMTTLKKRNLFIKSDKQICLKNQPRNNIIWKNLKDTRSPPQLVFRK